MILQQQLSKSKLHSNVLIDFENWAWYRTGEGKMLPEDIDPSLCTHIMYGFATLNPTTLLLEVFDPWADITNGN